MSSTRWGSLFVSSFKSSLLSGFSSLTRTFAGFSFTSYVCLCSSSCSLTNQVSNVQPKICCCLLLLLRLFLNHLFPAPELRRALVAPRAIDTSLVRHGPRPHHVPCPSRRRHSDSSASFRPGFYPSAAVTFAQGATQTYRLIAPELALLATFHPGVFEELRDLLSTTSYSSARASRRLQ